MSFLLLGNVQVRTPAGPVPLSGPRQQKVLSALLLAAGRVVTVSALIDAVWEAEPPRTAVRQIRNLVTALRRILVAAGASPTVIVAEATGFRIDLTGCRFDVQEFDDLTRAGDFPAALQLWRGPALTGLDGETLRTAATALAERRLSVIERHFTAQLAAGGAFAPEELTQVVAENPLREGLVALAMTALYRADRQSDAIDAYTALRTRLADELGVEPARPVRELYERILRQELALAPNHTDGQRQPPQMTSVVACSQDAVPRRLPRRHRRTAGGARDLSDMTAGHVCRQSLPYGVADFTGRAMEIRTCHRLVSTRSGSAPMIIAVDGMAGSGKSTLALHLAHHFADHFPDGQFFFDLHGHTPDRDPVPPHIAATDFLRRIGVSSVESSSELDHCSALLRSKLAKRRTLIVFDNAVNAAQVSPLLPGSSGHLVLITSRQRLVDLDGVAHVTIEPMPEPDAVDLFARIAQHPVEDQPAVAEVVALCGYLPLAIRLAAIRLRSRPTWSVAALADRLRDEQHRLVELSAGSQSVAGTFELSYRQLTTWQQQVFRLLGSHPGPDIDPYATAALCGLAVPDARRGLEQLTEVHLLREHAPERYAYHDLLRVHARATADKHDPPAVRQAALTRLLDYYVQAASQANLVVDPLRWQYPTDAGTPQFALPVFTSRGAVLQWWETERANLLTAIQTAAQAGLDTHAWQLTQALAPFFSQMDYAQDRYDPQYTALRSARRTGDQTAEINILVDLASAGHRLGRLSMARAHYENAAKLAQDIGNPFAEARALARLGVLDQAEGDYRQAEGKLSNTLTLFRSIDDRGTCQDQ
ncbi:MAG: AfsR/SARP family transcriptional regulator [Sciscionella sp.]